MAKPRLLLLLRSDELLVQFLARIPSFLYNHCWGCFSNCSSCPSECAERECTVSKVPKM